MVLGRLGRPKIQLGEVFPFVNGQTAENYKLTSQQVLSLHRKRLCAFDTIHNAITQRGHLRKEY